MAADDQTMPYAALISSPHSVPEPESGFLIMIGIIVMAGTAIALGKIAILPQKAKAENY
jgi:hypothetical protein